MSPQTGEGQDEQQAEPDEAENGLLNFTTTVSNQIAEAKI